MEATRGAGSPAGVDDLSAAWLQGVVPSAPISSNIGSGMLPFQRWFRFKEAFSPDFVRKAIAACPYEVRGVIDVCAGSGTTAITCRALGLNSTSVEVNPFLADLVRAKITPVSPRPFFDRCQELIDQCAPRDSSPQIPEGAPSTLVEPGHNDRWVYDYDAYLAVSQLLSGMQLFPSDEQRLAKVALASILIDISNVLVNGKGRRYRKNWRQRRCGFYDVLSSFDQSLQRVTDDLERFTFPDVSTHQIINTDCRSAFYDGLHADLAVFSPPYPNSFDYTDVYNLELWVLGYLGNRAQNASLRQSTLRSHVQIKWERGVGPTSSNSLRTAYRALSDVRSELWNPRIPDMVCAYFDDLAVVFSNLAKVLDSGKHVSVAIGDSQYRGVKIDVSQILAEIVEPLGFVVVSEEPIRSMRASAQHGGALCLTESAITFQLQ